MPGGDPERIAALLRQTRKEDPRENAEERKPTSGAGVVNLGRSVDADAWIGDRLRQIAASEADRTPSQEQPKDPRRSAIEVPAGPARTPADAPRRPTGSVLRLVLVPVLVLVLVGVPIFLYYLLISLP